LDALLTLPNKDKVEKINFFGNKISEVDLAKIFTEFPNLKYLNLDYNPLSAKNLNNLTDKQLERLVEGMKNKKIRLSANKGTILADLLEYAQELIKKGGSSSAHKLQAILQNSSVEPSNKGGDNSKMPLIIVGAIVVVIGSVLVGYLLGKKNKSQELED